MQTLLSYWVNTGFLKVMKELYSSAEPWGHGCGQILSPALHLHISLRNRPGACPAVLKNQYKFLFQINARYPIPTYSRVSLVSPQIRVSYQFCLIRFLLWFPPNTTNNFKFPVVQMTKRFYCTKGPQCAGILFCFGFFHNSHNNMRQTMSQSHHTVVWKGKQNTKQSSTFLSMIIMCPEGLRDFPKVTWIGRILGNPQKQRRERRTMSHHIKALDFQKEKEKS